MGKNVITKPVGRGTFVIELVDDDLSIIGQTKHKYSIIMHYVGKKCVAPILFGFTNEFSTEEYWESEWENFIVVAEAIASYFDGADVDSTTTKTEKECETLHLLMVYISASRVFDCLPSIYLPNSKSFT